MERRRPPTPQKPTPVPHDYLHLVGEVFAGTFAEALATLRDAGRAAAFEATGELYPDEVLLSVTLVPEGQQRALTVHASADFDLSEGTAVAETVLAACVDAAGSLFHTILSADLAAVRWSALLDEAPSTWAPFEISGRTVYLRADTENPRFERLAEEWLAEHDPGTVTAPDKGKK